VELTSRRNPSGALDAGAAPVRSGGRVFLVEHVDPKAHPLISTNDIAFDLPAILAAPLPLPWRVARKQVEGREALQLEQVTGEVTALADASGRPLLPSAYLEVPREDPEQTRFEPVKAREDLPRVAARIARRYAQ
jgi:UTP--glucose-1-phosphate uridylyltransferase